jgi:hypothetical protein
MNCTQFEEQAIANLKLLQYEDAQVNTFVHSQVRRGQLKLHSAKLGCMTNSESGLKMSSLGR